MVFPTKEEKEARSILKKAKIEDYSRRRSIREVKHMESAPSLYQRPLLEAYAGTASPKNAIKAKCQECVGFENVVDRIRNCTALCALRPYRPYQVKT